MKKELLTTKPFILAGILVLLIIGGVYFFTKQSNSPYKVVVFESGKGWGYQIEIKGKAFIYQPSMPAIEGNNPFPTKKATEKTGRLVVKKLKSKQIPSVTKEELQEILKN